MWRLSRSIVKGFVSLVKQKRRDPKIAPFKEGEGPLKLPKLLAPPREPIGLRMVGGFAVNGDVQTFLFLVLADAEQAEDAQDQEDH